MTTVKSHQAQPGGNTCRLSSWSYLNVLPFHDEVAAGVRYVPFMDRTIPVLDCGALAVFKAMFDRTKDWADIEAMVEGDSIDLEKTATKIQELDGQDSHRAQRLLALRV